MALNSLFCADVPLSNYSLTLRQSTSKCFFANSLLGGHQVSVYFDPMIVCILSVPATLSSFFLPSSLQKMQHLSIFQLCLQHKTTEYAYFAENIGMNFTEMA